LLDGCVQPVMAPNINLAAARVFDRAGVSLVRAKGAGCCGAVSQHLGAEEEAREFMRRNIDAWWPHIEAGTEAIVITASGCGSVIKEYGYHLRDDPVYAEKAACIAELTRDISEVAVQLGLSRFCQGQKNQPAQRVAFHVPCSLQHGQKITGVVEGILQEAGYTLTQVPDAHLCCGSAGTYSLLQPQLSQQLLANKLQVLQTEAPDMIATANIGCLNHLASKAQVPVVHWIELLAK
jgi:glycolate oxidase iron-sulfur subunit